VRERELDLRLPSAVDSARWDAGHPQGTAPAPADRTEPFNALARWFQAVPFRIVDDAPPLRDLVVIRAGEPNAALGYEPFNQLLSLRPPVPRAGSLAIGRPRAGGWCRLTATSDRRVIVEHQTPPSREASAERQSLDIQSPPPSLETRSFDGPIRPYRAERHPSAVGVPWDFSGTFSLINRHEHERAERPFAQVSGDHTPITAGHGAG